MLISLGGAFEFYDLFLSPLTSRPACGRAGSSRPPPSGFFASLEPLAGRRFRHLRILDVHGVVGRGRRLRSGRRSIRPQEPCSPRPCFGTLHRRPSWPSSAAASGSTSGGSSPASDSACSSSPSIRILSRSCRRPCAVAPSPSTSASVLPSCRWWRSLAWQLVPLAPFGHGRVAMGGSFGLGRRDRGLGAALRDP